MKCPRCGTDSPSDAAFCPQCGAKLICACARCGTGNAPQHRFCKKCGHPMVAPGGRKESPRLAPDTYTPKHLAEKILTSRAALEGERKQVTVLFADLKGSMELLADRDPEEARTILDPVLEHMMEAVHRYEGTVNQVMGDGIMALFGAPLALGVTASPTAQPTCFRHYSMGGNRYEAWAAEDGARRGSFTLRK
jgi:class 3 adenylate cyclase